jgi:hypothetical protein
MCMHWPEVADEVGLHGVIGRGHWIGWSKHAKTLEHERIRIGYHLKTIFSRYTSDGKDKGRKWISHLAIQESSERMTRTATQNHSNAQMAVHPVNEER